MAQKIIISKPTYDVLIDTNVDHHIFNSNYNTLKYYVSGSYTLTTNFANYYSTFVFLGVTFYKHKTIQSISHNLGYAPFFVSYILGYAGADKYNMCPGTFVDAGYSYLSMCYCDSTKIYFADFINNTDNSGTLDDIFKYKIFKNNLGL